VHILQQKKQAKNTNYSSSSFTLRLSPDSIDYVGAISVAAGQSCWQNLPSPNDKARRL